MKKQELYQGFSKEKQKEYETYLIDQWGEIGEKLITDGKKNTQSWKKEDYEKLHKDGDDLYKQLAEVLKANLKTNSQAVQILIDKHFQLVKRIYNPTKEVYRRFGQLYIEHPDFKEFFEPYDPGLPEYLAEANKSLYRKKIL